MFINILLSLLIFILIILLIFKFKPSMMFDLNGNVKKYNLRESILTLDLLAPIIALLCYYITLIII